MKTWETVKEEIKNQSESDRINIEAIEAEINLVNKIVQKRKERGLTQKQLADKIDVSLYQIKKFESQVSSPRLDLTLSVMIALGFDIRKIIYGTYPHCIKCDKNKEYPCARAYYLFRAKK